MLRPTRIIVSRGPNEMSPRRTTGSESILISQPLLVNDWNRNAKAFVSVRAPVLASVWRKN